MKKAITKNSFKFEWVNHASFIINDGNLSLISDPWFEGKAFDNGWSLVSKSKFTINDFSRITHIWFSHEHPDHFSPPLIKKIPLEIRNNITVLYQETNDGKVVKFCKALGFKEVIILKNRRWYNLTNNVKLRCGGWRGGDSWSCIKVGNLTLLNMNDCVVNSPEELISLKKELGKIDVLLTQFSYAQWEGSVKDRKSRRKAAVDQIRQLEDEVDVFEPKYTVLMASFVWFSHVENYYMNDETNKVGKVFQILEENNKTKPVVLYPGEHLKEFSKHSSIHSIKRYDSDYKKIDSRENLSQSTSLDFEHVSTNATNFVERAKENRWYMLLKNLPPLRIYVRDYNDFFLFSLRNGLIKSRTKKVDIVISSDALNFCFENDWGFNTVHVNGRFDLPEGSSILRFILYEAIGFMMNHQLNLIDSIPLAFSKIISKKQTLSDNKSNVREFWWPFRKEQ